MTDPAEDITYTDKKNDDTHSIQSMSFKRALLETHYKEKQIKDDADKLGIEEESMNYDDKAEDIAIRKKLKKTKKEQRLNETSHEMVSTSFVPEETPHTSLTTKEKTPQQEDIHTPSNEGTTPSAAFQKDDRNTSAEASVVLPVTGNQSTERPTIELTANKDNIRPRNTLTEEKSEMIDLNKSNEDIIKAIPNKEQHSKPEETTVTTVAIPTSVAKGSLGATTDEEGKKLGPKISGIGPGTVRNIGSGSFKGSSVPLLLSMPTGGGGLSLLSAGLPPGRYVILPSTTSTVPSISSIPTTTSTVGIKTNMTAAPMVPVPKTISMPILPSSTSTTASLSTTTATTNVIASASAPSVLAPRTPLGRVMRTMARGGYYGGRGTRGRRKSYTAAEKLAMIEAVEAGRKKSNVADLFGVAPSTLACILLQKNKIRSDQMKVDPSRRRLRQSRQSPILPSPQQPIAPAVTEGGETEGANETPNFFHFLSALSPHRPPVFEESPEEIVSMPDLSERIGMEGSPMTSKMESGSSYLTCSPLLSGMPGIHEDPMPVAGPSSSSHDQQEEILPPEYDQEEIEVKSEPIFRASSEICEDDNSQNNTQSSSDRPSSHSSPTSGMTGPYLLKKETHCSTILDQLLRDDTFSDVTLTAEGQSIKAHKIVLCLASAYFRQVLSKESSVQNVIVFRDIKFSELRNLINFIYTGEATVDAAELESFMRTAEMLEVNSLCEGHRTLPKNLIPKSKEAEPEKTKLSSGSSKRSHSSMVASPPMKTRRIVSTDSSPSSKISKVATYPSTSTEGGSVPPPTTSSATYPTCVIKSEPPSDEGEEREFCPRVDENKGLPETSMESPRHYEEPDQSPPLDRIDDLPEKVPLGKCPFCPNPQQQPSLFGSSLTNHVHLCHPEKTAFPCDICSRVFLKKRSFEAHKEDCIR